MTRQDLIDHISAATGGDIHRKLIAEVVDAAFAQMSRALRDGERVSWPGFGTFEVRERSERSGRNPRSGEEIIIPASKTIGFRPAKALKERI